MLKKIGLSSLFALLSFTSISPSTDRITSINKNLEYIAQAKKDINAEKEEISLINKKAKKYLKNKNVGHLVDFYHHQQLKEEIHSVLNQITSNDSFVSTINYATDFQIRCIINKHMAYNDIEYSQEAYPLEQETLIQAINSAIAHSSITSYTDGELLFNIYYLEATQRLGYKLLLEKLDNKENELLAELATLETAN